MRKREKGFSLIELLIVVAIILIIAAIAIPNLLRSRLAANEASAVGSLRTVTTSNITYFSTYGNGFGSTLGVLGGAAGTVTATCDNALLIDSVLSKNGAGGVVTKAGYTFTYTAGAANATKPTGCTAAGSATWSLTAVPQVVGSTGQRGFFVDGSAVITFTTDGSAPTNASTPL